MLRVAARVRPSCSLSYRGYQQANHQQKLLPSLWQSRALFWSGDSSNGNDDDDEEKKTTQEKDDPKKEQSSNKSTVTSKTEVEETDVVFGPASARRSSSSSGGAALPTKLGFGDQAPRYPHLTALPVLSRPIFPGIISSVTLTDPATISALEAMTKPGGVGGYVGVFLRKSQNTHTVDFQPELITDPSELYNVGSFAQIHRLTRGHNPHHQSNSGLPPGGMGNTHLDNDDDEEVTASLLLMGHRRIDLLSVDEVGPPIDVTVSHWDRLEYSAKEGDSPDMIRAITNEILSTIREVAQLNPLFRDQVQFFPTRVDANDPYRLADFAASITTSGTSEELQAVLEERDPERRLHKALCLLVKEREVSKLQQEISAKVEEKMTASQRKYFLMEQLKSIKKELGMEKDDKETLIEKYRKKLKEFADDAIPKEVNEVIESEMEKLSTLEKNSSEFNVTRSYLDWLTGIPWGITSEENFDIQDARRILDKDHYGLDEVKDIILQFIAIGKLKGTVQGKILCLAGPPGTGKTSIAKSIAEALGRKFYRFSVGGLSDVSEIKGHRRTYVGAMPGKLIQCLKTTGTTNPLVLIDEIDKLGSDHRGDPASALLEVLDPSQNSSFRDHFLDVPVDVSKVLFMCTANDLSRIPGPLIDRMEIIQLSGYDVPEKIAIADQYLVPKSMRENGLMVEVKREEEEDTDNGEEKKDEEVELEKSKKVESFMSEYSLGEDVPKTLTIAQSAIESLVRWYCREAGVRNLYKHIDKITRKLALQIVAEKEGATLTDKSTRKSDTWEITDENLSEYVGKPIFTSDRLYETDPLPNGIVMGLAWTSMGGSALYIETQGIKRSLDSEGKRRGGGNLKVTGQLGDVMKESTQIAYTVARARMEDINSTNSFFDDFDVHMHVPEGATPKDGPSAGVTMITAMLSLALDKPIRNDLAMTGEVSLTGKVLAIGGVKEKTMAARRAGIKCIIFPSANKRDFDEIPDYLKEGLEVHYAEDYSKVYEVAFG